MVNGKHYVSFSKLGNYGRLGNQLTEIAATLGIAERNNAQAVFPAWGYEHYFEDPLPHGEMQTGLIKESIFHYYDIEIKENTDLLGYFQSEKYFPSKLPFVIKQEHKDRLRAQYPGLWDKETICIQIRRGDYVNNPFYYQIPIHWYISALINEFPHWKDCNLVFFSDDLDYCKVHFECLPQATFTYGLNDIDQIVLMSMLDNHIIANGTFGWWGSYLSKSKKTVHCGKLFGENVDKDEKDFYPERWTLHTAERLDLRDCTFIIPVFFDHSDRKQNLDLSICMIQKSCDTNIIVGEQGGRKFEYTSKFCTYHHFEGMNQFHRTKMLNDMAMMADTPIVANWDCDVIIPPMQFYLTCEALRNGADMVFPYDGRFARFHRHPWFKRIEKLLDIGVIGNTPLRGKHDKPVPVTSVGGAIFFNKESFIDGGMENENMVSFGPEDHERHVRFLALGFRVERVGGCLYHIDHYVGVNSSTRHPHFKKNNDEFEKIKSLSSAALKEYVDGWSWRHKYTERYYRQISEGSVRSAAEVYKALVEIGIKPETVIDVGCGVGEWNNGINGYTGVDYKVPRKSLLVDNYIECNLETDTVKGNYDLCVCCEVLEHLTPERAEPIIEMLCGLSKMVLFSAAVKNQGGTGHINEQPASYWASLFQARGFYPHKVDLRKILFHNPNVETWYKNNLILFTKEKYSIDYELDFIHPDMFQSCIQYYKNQLIA